MATINHIPIEDLPYWMRQARRGRDWGIVLALSLGLLAALPFIINPGLPHTNAIENYVYLIADYADTLREGRLYPRWSPNALGGFGAPIPNFFPPGAPYAAAVLKVLFTDDAVLAVRIMFILAFSIAGITTYAFVRQRSTSAAGLLATTLYLFSPYVGQVAPHSHGNLAIVVGMALLPLLLWSANRLLLLRRTSDLLATTFAMSTLLLTHPQLAIIALTLSLLLVVWNIYTQPKSGASWILAIIGLSLGIGFAGFYWIPAFLERDLVEWVERLRPPAVNLAAIFSLPQPIDPNALQPYSKMTLGWWLPLLVLIVAVDRIRRRDLLNIYLSLLFTGFILIILALTLPAENWLLGPISLVLAISASGVANIQTPFRKHWQTIILLAAICLTSVPILYVPPWPENFGSVQPIDQINYEQRGFGIAVLPPESPLPTTLSTSLPTNYVLLSGYETGNLNRIAPNAAVRVNPVEHTGHQDRFQITTNRSTTLDVFMAYFPGWQALTGNEIFPMRRNPQNGLMLLDIPPMNGELTITFGSTPTRQMAWLVTWASLFILMLISWRGIPSQEHEPPEADLLDLRTVRRAIIIIILFGIARAFYAAPPNSGLANSQMLNRRTESGLEIIAYDLNAETYRATNKLTLNLYWQTVTVLPDNYQIRLTLLDADDSPPLQTTPLRAPGHYPTRRWRTFRYVTDTYHLTLPNTAGIVQFQIEAFECNPNCNDRLTFFDDQGGNLGPALTLPPQVVIIR